MNCVSVLESLSDYIDDDLEEEAGDEIDLHLGSCESCQAFANTLQRTVELCRDTIIAPLSPEEKTALCAAVREPEGPAAGGSAAKGGKKKG